jgi:chromosome segregation ATPase
MASRGATGKPVSGETSKAVAFGGMDEETGGDGLRERLTRQGEDALGRLAQDLLENPLVNGAIARAFEAREKASAAQEVAFGALNIPSAADIERLTRRVRSVSQRLEGIEDGVDRLDERLAALQVSLDAITKELVELRTSAVKPAAKPAAAKPTPPAT